MDETRLRTIEQLQQFLSVTPKVAFTAPSACSAADNQRYEHISRALARFDYPQRGKRERGVVLAYLRRTSGYGRTQLTRLVSRWTDNRVAQHPLVKRYRAPAAPFARKYTATDVELLVEMHRAHEDVCGPAVAHLLQRAHTVYGDPRYERLADLSVSHLHNLRKRADYQARRVSFVKTRAVYKSIGLRKASSPNGRAGFVRIDTVHQGDLNGVKGVYFRRRSNIDPESGGAAKNSNWLDAYTSPPWLQMPQTTRTVAAPTSSNLRCAAGPRRLSELPSCPPICLMDMIIRVTPSPFKVRCLDAYCAAAEGQVSPDRYFPRLRRRAAQTLTEARAAVITVNDSDRAEAGEPRRYPAI